MENLSNTNEVKKSKRVSYVDIARGIAIILMVLGHVYPYGTFISRKVIYSFHMPLFIIVSGMFFKENEKLKDLIIKICKKLLIPYVIAALSTSAILFLLGKVELNFNSILGIIKQILLGYSNYRTFWPETPTMGALWFIPFLALTRIIFFIISKICKSDKARGIVSVIVTVVGVILAKNSIFLPWSFDVVLAAMVFYYAGYILKKYDYLEKLTGNTIIIAILFNVWYIGLLFQNIDLAVRKYSIIGYIVAISGSIIVLWISKLIDSSLKQVPKALKWYGFNSMYILCFHYFGETVIKYEEFGITNMIAKFIVKIILLTIATFITTKISDTIKNKKLIKEKGVTNE